ncbi:MAG: tRNA (guanosine(46)-N7)-methyltransferase TrmB [Tannerellaceae bacterium]|jgi:tRNA (guanine-N7-)-methyltransferase|nr:tRNA (guanosine(46)-N7)-methyltransferase TrmB [Tannerellaceae bacterium]
MGKNKQSKFKDMAAYPHVFQYPFDKLREEGFDMKGRWGEGFFKNTRPIVLELGCGKGEYTVGLGQRFPERNFIGVDIKGARMWSGAKASLEAGMNNVAFVRTHIEWIDAFFAPGEVEEIWITFPDPQMKKRTKGLTSASFLRLYSRLLAPGGIVHLKTDSRFLYAYTLEVLRANDLPVLFHTADLYLSYPAGEILSIRTFYEQQWLQRGLPIRYICFQCEERSSWIEPDAEIEPDDYRSFGRQARSMPASGNMTNVNNLINK